MKWYSFSPLILQKLIWIPTRFSLKFFGRLSIDGLDNLKGMRNNFIFVCNHSSELDPFFVPSSLPFFSRFSPMFYITREKEFYDESGWRQIFYGGFFFRMWGGYPVFVGLRDYEKALSQHISLLKDGVNICIFPEGKTTPNGKIQSAKGGVSYLSIRTNVPIIPVAISGTYKLSVGDFLARRRKMSIVFGKPIYPEELKSGIFLDDGDFSAYKEMSDRVMRNVSELMR